MVLILNDSSYGMIRWKQASLELPDFGLNFQNPCFVKYAASYGANGHRIETAEQLLPQLRHCLDAGGIHLIDVAVDYSENDRILNHVLPRRSAQI